MKGTLIKNTELQIYSSIQCDNWTSDATEIVQPIDHPNIQAQYTVPTLCMSMVKHRMQVNDNTKHAGPVCCDTERIDHCCSHGCTPGSHASVCSFISQSLIFLRGPLWHFPILLPWIIRLYAVALLGCFPQISEACLLFSPWLSEYKVSIQIQIPA